MARKKKRKASKAEQVADLMEGMSDTQLGEVEDLIAGSAQGERIRGLQGTVGVDTAAPPTAFAAKRTLGDTGPDAIRSRGAIDASTRAQTRRGLEAQASANTGITPEEPRSRLDRLKGFVGGGARAIGGGIKRAADWANQEELGEGFDERKKRIARRDEQAEIQANPRQGVMEPSFSGFPAPPAAGAGADEGKTSSQRAAEAAKRAYLAQQERTRAPQGAGGAEGQPTQLIQMPEGALNSQPPHPKNAPDRFKNAPQNRQPSAGPAARGNEAVQKPAPLPPRTQYQPPAKPAAETPEQKEKRNLRGGNMMTPVGPASPRPTAPVGDYPRQPKRNPLLEGSFSTGGMSGSQGIRDAAGKAGLTGERKAPQGPQMGAAPKDAGAMRPDAQARVSEQGFRQEVEGLLQRAKQGERRAQEELDALFEGQADRAEPRVRGAGKPTRTLDKGATGTIGGQRVPAQIQQKVLSELRTQYGNLASYRSSGSRRRAR